MALITEENCHQNALAITRAVADGSAPSWFQNIADWFTADTIDCQTMINATGWMLQEDIIDVGSFKDIFQEILQDANLVGLGKASRDISEALNEQIAIRESQRLEDQESLIAMQELQDQFNALVSSQLVDLGEATTMRAEEIKALGEQSFFGDLITGALGGSSLIVLGIILVVMIGRK